MPDFDSSLSIFICIRHFIHLLSGQYLSINLAISALSKLSNVIILFENLLKKLTPTSKHLSEYPAIN